MTTDEFYMQRCLQLARNGVMGAPPNPMVGAVIVCDGRIIGEGYHARCGQGHAEVNAFASVRETGLLKRSTIYVSLEPCSHYGKTPPCAKLIIEKGVRRVVVGCVDPFAKVHGRGIQMLRDAGIEVTVGVLEQECLALNRRFITFNTHRRPFVTLKWAQTTDGIMGRRGEGMLHISTPQTFRRSHHLRATRMAILVGFRTAMQDNPSLTTRLWDGPNPTRVVIDPEGALPHTIRLFNGEAPTLVFTRHPGHFAGLEQENAGNTHENVGNEQGNAGTEQGNTGTKHNRIKPILLKDEALTAREILDALYQEGLQSLIVEGGAQTLQLFINENLWDEAFVERSTLTVADIIRNTNTVSSDAGANSIDPAALVPAPTLRTLPADVLRYPRSLIFCYQNKQK